MPERRRAQMVELEVPGSARYERLVCAAAVTVAQHLGLGPDRAAALETAVGEAYRNAVQHGNGGDEAQPVRVTFRARPAVLVVDVRDRGSGFECPPPPDIDAQLAGRERCGGWGLHLMRGLVDDLTFHVSRHGGHRTRLQLSIPNHGQAAREGDE